jgi:predicted small secreted protein
MKRTLTAIFSVAVMAFFMVGCSTTRLVENDVTAFYSWSAAPPGPGTAYRFERLPSQQVVGAQQDYVEERARAALAKVGMELNPAVALYSVQVRVSTQVIERLAYDGAGYDGFGFATPGVFLGGSNQGAAVGLSLPMRFSEPYYRRELTLLIRDLGTHQVVFETRALSDGVQGETLAVLSAMLDAALRGFPQPPPGPRRINVQIPR